MQESVSVNCIFLLFLFFLMIVDYKLVKYDGLRNYVFERYLLVVLFVSRLPQTLTRTV